MEKNEALKLFMVYFEAFRIVRNPLT